MEDLEPFSRLLEVGCGYGHFLAQAVNSKAINAEGIELNPKAVEQARSRGLSVHQIHLREASTRFSGQFDAVACFQVLEHVSNPKEFLDWLCNLLRPGGILILGVPNADSFLKHQFNLLDMPPHHLSRWSHKSLEFLPKALPLGLKRLSNEPLAHHHVNQYVESHMAFMKKRVPAKIVYKLMRAIILGIVSQPKIRKNLKGHTIYTCFKKI